MIKEILDNKILNNLKYNDIYEGKIKVLFDTYGKDNNFCKFYTQDNSLILSKLNRDFVIKQNDDNFNEEELALFLKINETVSVFLPPNVLRRMEPFIKGEYLYNMVLEFVGDREFYDLNETPPLDDVYEILKHSFNINYETWLPDLSHRIRHGISKSFIFNGVSTLTVLYDRDGIVFITQVATLAEARGQGTATKLLREVAGRYKNENKRVFLVCRKSMLNFYEKVGFKMINEAAQIYRLDF